MAESPTNSTENNGNFSSGNHKTTKIKSVSSVTAVQPVALTSATPDSLPVGSLINVSPGTTFNLISSDQIQLSGTHFKPLICVDNNGCICDSGQDKDSDDLKPWVRSENGQLVIQDGGDESSTTCSHNNPITSWTDFANMPVLPVRCKSTNAELYKSKFGSGGRGRCIKLLDKWYTPSEFETLCGRASSKDWKRSIRFGGRRLQTLIDEGILVHHATSCTCSACCDDETATGPVRLFTPYKRRKRKNTSDGEGGSPRKLKPHQGDSIEEESSDSNAEGLDVKETWNPAQLVPEVNGNPSATASEPTVTTDVVATSTNSSVSDDELLKRLDKMSSQLVKISETLRRFVVEAKVQVELEMEQLKEQAKTDKERAVLAARVEAQVECSRGVFDTAVSDVDSINTVTLQPTTDSMDSKKCANCNREAFAECSLCRHTPYCSTFCQRKDWSSHQVECIQSDQGSIMLIVESSDQVLSQA